MILSLIYRDYICDEETKKEILLKDSEEIKKEEILKEKYNAGSSFKSINTKIKTVEKTADIVEYRESIFKKIKTWFKHFFKK